MLTETLSIWRKNFFVFVGLAVHIFIVARLVAQPGPSSLWLGLYSVAQLTVGCLVQRSVIFQIPSFAGFPPERKTGKFYRSLGIERGVIILSLTVFAGVTVLGRVTDHDPSKAALFASIILVDLFVGKLLPGIWLSASIKVKNTDLSDALARGLRGFKRSYPKILAIVAARLVVFGCAAAVLYYASGDGGHYLSQNTAFFLVGLFALINVFLGSMVDVLFAMELRNEIRRTPHRLFGSFGRQSEESISKINVYRHLLVSEIQRLVEANRAPELCVPQPIPRFQSEDLGMRNAPVAAIVYELLYDFHKRVEALKGPLTFHNENCVEGETFSHDFINKWEWSTSILEVVGAIAPIYSNEMLEKPPEQRRTPFYRPVMTLEQFLEVDFSAFETFDNYCYAMHTFDQFLDRKDIRSNKFSPLFVENFIKKDDVFFAQRPKNGQFLVEWDWERFREKVIPHWDESPHEFKPKD